MILTHEGGGRPKMDSRECEKSAAERSAAGSSGRMGGTGLGGGEGGGGSGMTSGGVGLCRSSLVGQVRGGQGKSELDAY